MAVIANEVKKEIVEKVKQGEPVATLATQYGVSDRSIYAWLKRKASGNISVLEHNKLKRENTLLKEIIGALTIELEKTKKKTGFK
ncbi:MAG: transposase [Candidatus Beckwithbacteria bacterium]|nr:transposase [Patescibacteria group bacterium]